MQVGRKGESDDATGVLHVTFAMVAAQFRRGINGHLPLPPANETLCTSLVQADQFFGHVPTGESSTPQ